MGELGAELAALCRGRGVMEPNLKERVGPALLSRSGIDPAVSPVEFRYQLVSLLDQVAGDLADDLGLVFRAGLGLRRNLQGRFLTQRLERVAGELGRHPDTVRDYLSTAIAAVAAALADWDHAAEMADGLLSRWQPGVPPKGMPAEDAGALGTEAEDDGSGHPACGWHLARLRTFLDLAGIQPVAVEERTVVADRNELAVVAISTTIRRYRAAGTAVAPGVNRADVAVMYGGSLAHLHWLSATYLRYLVRLPYPLRRGESHEFGVRLAIPPGQPFDPQYVFTPLLRCDEFGLRVRFGARARQARVWRIAALPPGLVDDFADPAEMLCPDAAGEVRLRFADPRIGLAHGARWTSLRDSLRAWLLPPGPRFTCAGSGPQLDQLSGPIGLALPSRSVPVALRNQRHRAGTPRSG